METTRLVVLIGILACLGIPTDLPAIDVDLAFGPVTQTAQTGETVDVQLIASSAGVIPQGVVAIDAIMTWDPAVLSLQEIVSGGGFAWFVSDFLTDPGGLNTDLTDGEVLYTALTSPGTPAVVQPSPGLVVATFRFVALQNSPGTPVALLPATGTFAQTRVLFLFAEDITGDTSSFATVVVGAPDPGFKRGDPNNDNNLNIADGVWILSYLFQSGAAPPCLDAGDSNDDGGVDVSDPVYIFGYLFTRGPPPPAPFLACGFDTTPDALDCAAYSHCP